MSEDEGPQYDPTLFATAYKSHRFYLFTKREPDDSGMSISASVGGDV